MLSPVLQYYKLEGHGECCQHVISVRGLTARKMCHESIRWLYTACAARRSEKILSVLALPLESLPEHHWPKKRSENSINILFLIISGDKMVCSRRRGQICTLLDTLTLRIHFVGTQLEIVAHWLVHNSSLFRSSLILSLWPQKNGLDMENCVFDF